MEMHPNQFVENLHHRRINSKAILYIGFTAILVLMLMLTFLGPYGMRSIHNRLQQIVQTHMEKIDLAVHMRAAARDRSLLLHKMILSNDPFDRDDAWMKFNANGAKFARDRINLKAMKLTDKEIDLLDKQANISSTVIPLQFDIVELINQEKFEEAEQLLVHYAIPLQDQVMTLLEDLYHFQEDAADEAAQKSDQKYAEIRDMMYLLSGCVLLLSILIVLTMFRKIRYAEIQNEHNVNELKISRDKAQAAYIAKTQFLATMSHELRTPLNAVIGYSDLLISDLSDPEVQVSSEHADFAMRIKRSGTHLLNIISKILHVSRIEAGKATIKKQLINVKEIVELSFSAVLPMAKENNNHITVDCPDSIGSFYTDDIKLEQILINLLSNACKYTENGEITLSTNKEKHNNNDWVTFTVSDTGIGILSEHHESIFEPFTQADNSFTRKYEGVGLGLSVCKKYCELLGGEIKVQSAPGKGSEFTVRLPDVNQ